MGTTLPPGGAVGGEAAREILPAAVQLNACVVGASMMVGGNIKGQTRVLTTAIVLETSKGEFGTALALSALLLVITYLINLALTWIQQKGRKR